MEKSGIYNLDNSEHWKVLVLLLKEVAEDKNITHQQIADITGLKRSNITRFFNLNYKPRLDTFLLIANAIQVNFFFEDRESKSDLNILFEQAMTKLFRRPNNSISKN